MDPIRTRAYQELRARLGDVWRAANAPCWLCGQPIDWDAPANDQASYELDHALPRKTHPHLALDPGNCRPSHSRCNRTRGTRTPGPGLGEATEDW